MRKRKKQQGSPLVADPSPKRRSKQGKKQRPVPITMTRSVPTSPRRSTTSKKRKRNSSSSNNNSNALDHIFGGTAVRQKTRSTNNRKPTRTTTNNKPKPTVLPTTVATTTAWTTTQTTRFDYWDRLDQELTLFGQFVKLHPSEYKARVQWIQNFQTLLMEHNTVQVFGSFSNPDVCTFLSDIDLSLWKQPSPAAVAATTIPKQGTSAVSTTQTTPVVSTKQPPPQVSGKEAAKGRWLRALDAALSSRRDTIHNDDDNGADTVSTKAALPQKQQPSLLESTEDHFDSNCMALDRTGDATDGKEEGKTNDHADNNEEPEESNLFVLDRTGDAKYAKYTNDNDDKEEPLQEESDHDSADPIRDAKRRKVALGADNATVSYNATAVMRRFVTASELGCDSDDDTTISVQGNSDDDTEQQQSPLQVSMVSNTKTGPRNVGSTVIPKRHVLNELQKIQWKLRRRECALADRVDFIKFARVPILKIRAMAGFDVDVSVGGNAVDTSAYTNHLMSRYRESFSTTILFLKILLNQHELDTPFTGGLGSYKLYVLLAKHLQGSKSREGEHCERPSRILIGFLERYSQANCLSREVPVVVGHATADLSNVSRLGDIVQLFGMCVKRLKGNHTSILSRVVDGAKLMDQRRGWLLKFDPAASKRIQTPIVEPLVVETHTQSNSKRRRGGKGSNKSTNKKAKSNSPKSFKKRARAS